MDPVGYIDTIVVILVHYNNREGKILLQDVVQTPSIIVLIINVHPERVVNFQTSNLAGSSSCQRPPFLRSYFPANQPILITIQQEAVTG